MPFYASERTGNRGKADGHHTKLRIYQQWQGNEVGPWRRNMPGTGRRGSLRWSLSIIQRVQCVSSTAGHCTAAVVGVLCTLLSLHVDTTR
jgi:hypothetical protein